MLIPPKVCLSHRVRFPMTISTPRVLFPSFWLKERPLPACQCLTDGWKRLVESFFYLPRHMLGASLRPRAKQCCQPTVVRRTTSLPLHRLAASGDKILCQIARLAIKQATLAEKKFPTNNFFSQITKFFSRNRVYCL